MADLKISALTASTVPLAGTEVLPIVQSGTTKQVSVANLTAGRAISATQLTLTTGSVIVANGQGVDFSATPGTGTSELFADYEEGTWTPTVAAAVGSITAYTASGIYTVVGRLVTATLVINISNNGTGSVAVYATLPFTNGSSNYVGAGREDALTGGMLQFRCPASTNNAVIATYANAYPGGTGARIYATITYSV
jgi:hypothetical protein